MTDFRQRLYERYTSTFKTVDASKPPEVLAREAAYYRRNVLDLLGSLPRDAAILELGCGLGHVVSLLREDGYTRAEGIDVSPEQVAKGKALGRPIEQADALAWLESRPAAYEAILGLDFIEHFPREELFPLLDRIHAALKPGGMLLLKTPNGEGLFAHQVVYGDLTHLTIFTASSLQQVLSVCGFGDFQFRESRPVLAGIKGWAYALVWRAVKRAANTIRRIESGKQQALWTENFIGCCRKH